MAIDNNIFNFHTRAKEICKNSFENELDTSDDYPLKDVVKCMIILNNKIDNICDAIIALHKDKNIVATNILYRSLIEHGSRQMYIYLRAGHEGDDTQVAKEYLKIYPVYELLLLIKNRNNANRFLNKEPLSDNLINSLKDTEFDFSKRLCDEIGEKFSFKKLQKSCDYFARKKSINGKTETNEYFKAPILSEMFHVYSETSTYIHGGTIFDTLIIKPEEKKNDEYENLLKITLLYSFASKVHTLSVLSYQNRYTKEFLKVYKLEEDLKKVI